MTNINLPTPYLYILYIYNNPDLKNEIGLFIWGVFAKFVEMLIRKL